MYLRKNKTFILFINLLLISFFLFFWHGAKANIIVVDDPTGDDIDNGLCSIMEAVANVNDGSQIEPDCSDGAGADVISLQTNIVLDNFFATDGSGVPYAISVPGITIEGNGYTIERDSLAPEFRIFQLVGNQSYEINNLTIKNGDIDSYVSGMGAAFNLSAANSFTLNNVNFEDNFAVDGAAIYLDVITAPNTIISINNSSFSNNISTNNGGALYLLNSLTSLNVDISESDFSNNSASNGTSIYVEGGSEVNINRTNFNEDSPGSGNVTYFNNSNVEFIESGFYSSNNGAIQVENSDLLIEKTSFDSMRAGINGGVLNATNSIINIVNSTMRSSLAFGGAGGAIYLNSNGNTLNVSHSTFLGNNTGGGSGGDIASGGIQNSGVIENNIFISAGYNDICAGDFTNFTFLNNLYSHTDADCGITANPATDIGNSYENGGYVETVPLLIGSSAIDTGIAGTLGCPDADARGVPRPFGSACDIGAFEFTGVAEVLIEETDGGTSVSEPDTEDEYTIVLGEAPTSSVTIDLEKSSNDFDVSPSSVTFTTLNWFNPRTITVTAEDNSDDDGDRVESISHILDTSDTVYELVLADNVVVNIADDDESGGGGTTTSSSGSSGGQPPRVYGCTDSTALNYNPSANTSDNSCDYFVWIYFGCDDPSATNYDVRVTNNNGTCIYEISRVPGCTNSSALNYNSSATEDDGSCSYAPPALTPGCMDSLALNFNSSADIDDGSCEYEDTVTPEIPEEVEPVVVPPVVPQPPAPPTTPVIIPETVTALDMAMEVLSSIFKNISEVLGVIVENISENTLQYGATAGVLTPIIIFLATNPGALVTVPIRIWTAIPTLLGIKRRKRPWGTVYDSVTKQPLDPVYLVLEDEYGNEIATTISDLDGRFGFIASPGRYKIRANKDGYEFPSRKMLGKTKDDLYENLYFNEFVEIQKEDDLLIKNIPMDSINFNWNEFEKSKNRSLMKFFSKTDLFLSGISDVVFVLGALLSLLLVFKSTSTLNLVIVGVYVLIVLLKIFGVSPKKPGHVINKENGNPISFGLVKIFSSNTGVEISHSVISKTGRYYALVPKGEYFVEISEKIGEDLYRPIYTSGLMKIKNGYLGNVFKV